MAKLVGGRLSQLTTRAGASTAQTHYSEARCCPWCGSRLRSPRSPVLQLGADTIHGVLSAGARWWRSADSRVPLAVLGIELAVIALFGLALSASGVINLDPTRVWLAVCCGLVGAGLVFAVVGRAADRDTQPRSEGARTSATRAVRAPAPYVANVISPRPGACFRHVDDTRGGDPIRCPEPVAFWGLIANSAGRRIAVEACAGHASDLIDRHQRECTFVHQTALRPAKGLAKNGITSKTNLSAPILSGSAPSDLD